MLTDQEITHFLEQGYVKLEMVFTLELAAEGRRILWKVPVVTQLIPPPGRKR
jgi:hypothetical protein